MPDLLVIGAGLTGLVAALTAAQAGMSVRVIAKGMGALHWSTGAIDVFGYTLSGEPVDHPVSALADLAPPHPYALTGSEDTEKSLAWFRNEAAQCGAEYATSAKADANIWLPSPVGAKRPTYLVPEAQAAGDVDLDAPIVVVGLQGMRDFYPDLIASNLNKQGIAARAAQIPVDTIIDRVDFNTVHLAQAVDSIEARHRLGKRLALIVKPGERAGLPAVLGLNDHAAVMADLRRLTDAEVFEIPTLPPSVPGIRLHRALCQRLETFGVRVETGMETIGFHAENVSIRWVETETSARPLRHRADGFLLATGGVLGGGFTSDAAGRFWESVFDLPVTAPAHRSAWFRPEFLDARGQPIFQAGIKVNDRFQPVDASGRPVFHNLWAAGGLLAHADPIRERSLEGLAIATGRSAALALVSMDSQSLAGT